MHFWWQCECKCPTIVTSNISIYIYIVLFISSLNVSGGMDYGYFPTSEFLALTLILADETEVLYPLLIRDDDIIENIESLNAVYVT